MTVSNTTATSTGTGDGSTKAFAYAFACLDGSELEVYVDDELVNSSLYSVARDETDNQGGTVTFLTAPANGAAIVINSVPSFEQGSDADNAGAFSLASIEELFDRAAIRDIYLKGLLDGGQFTGPAGEQGPSGTITVGTVTTGAAGSSVIVTNVGTTTAAIFDITIPRGNTGATGDTGDAAENPNFSVATGSPGTDVIISGTYPDLLLTVPRGSPGASGALGDGSYGDITVSGTGSVLTVANGAISVGKMANMAADTVLANITGGAAAPVAVTKANFKTWLAIAQGDVTSLTSDLAAKAPLASPALTGTPTAPTAATATNTTQIATTAYVKAQAYATLAAPALTGNATIDGERIGYRGLPLVTVSSSRNLATTDDSCKLKINGTYTLTIQPTGTVAYNDDFACAGYVASGTATIARGSGVDLYINGSTTSANGSITIRGRFDLVHWGSNVWTLNGTNVS
jgi:hypothetical protein